MTPHIQSRAWIYFILLPLLALFLSACSLAKYNPFKVCTMMGCRDTLRVNLISDVPDTFSIEVTADDGTYYQATCNRDEPKPSSPGSDGLLAICSPTSVTFFDFAPKEVTITLKLDTGEMVRSFRPVYSPFRPNGPDCPPECRSGELDFHLP